MIYFDGVHLSADSLDELHAFAERIGLKRCWFHGRARHPHYDITTPKKAETVLKNGASIVTKKQMVEITKKL